MRIRNRLIAGSAAMALAGAAFVGAVTASPAGALGHERADRHHSSAVFVQTDNPDGNQVVAYRRSASGALGEVAAYDTAGVGGVLTGSAVDHTASEGSLAYDAQSSRLVAVNAGSNTVSLFAVRGDRLQLLEVIGTGGTFPVSVAVHGDLVYVLNARDGGSVQGYRMIFGFLIPLLHSQRQLGLDPTATPEFTHTPGQVAFSPDGSQLLVTTKGNTSAVDVYAVRRDGRLSTQPVVNSLPGAVPFGVVFDAAGHAVVAEAGTNALATFTLNSDGTLSPIATLATGQAATCWVVADRGYFYASNAGSASLTGVRGDPAGNLSLVGDTGTDAGTVDAAVTGDGQFLYAQTGLDGVVDGFRVNADGTLSEVGATLVPNSAGGEGIVAS